MQAVIGNKVIITGKVARDAELKHMGEKNTALATFGVNVGNRQQKQADGTMKDVLDENGKRVAIWVNCQCWYESAAAAAEHIKKGTSVFCVGTVQQNTGSDGKVYKNLNVEFFSVQPTAENTAVSNSSTPFNETDIEEFSEDGVPF